MKAIPEITMAVNPAAGEMIAGGAMKLQNLAARFRLRRIHRIRAETSDVACS